ncbi:MAG: AlpA family phage regulatory protein [Zoogloeaceae bacterium]|jgi:predicted DNA-binding transcriptional regulator AlpA|nr:AlpA family phage regulatory protein [Zoogloeaceae bacterium]
MQHQLQPDSLYRANQIHGDARKGIPPILPISRATFWDWVKEGRFPQPVMRTGHVTLWRGADILAWLAAKSQKSRTA